MLFQDFSTTAGGEELTIFFLIIKKVQVKKSSWKKQDRERKKKETGAIYSTIEGQSGHFWHSHARLPSAQPAAACLLSKGAMIILCGLPNHG